MEQSNLTTEVEKKKTNFEESIDKFTFPALKIGFGIFIGTTLYYIVIWLLGNKPDPSMLGDFLGGYLGSALSLLTVILIYQTYLSQKLELKLQRDELKAQKESFEETRQYDLLYRELNSLKTTVDYYGVYKNMNITKVVEHFKEVLSDLKNIQKKPNDNFDSGYTTLMTNEYPLIIDLYGSITVIETILGINFENNNAKIITKQKIPANLTTLLDIFIEIQDECSIIKQQIANYNDAKSKDFNLKIKYILEFIDALPS